MDQFQRDVVRMLVVLLGPMLVGLMLVTSLMVAFTLAGYQV